MNATLNSFRYTETRANVRGTQNRKSSSSLDREERLALYLKEEGANVRMARGRAVRDDGVRWLG